MKTLKPASPTTDSRLLGSWKSDAAHTLAEWRWRKRIAPAKRAKFEAIFGKLVMTFTRTKLVFRLNGFEMAQSYSVLGTDENSVAIVKFGRAKVKNLEKYDPICIEFMHEALSDWKIEHIHFTGNHFWISLGANREFFRKMPHK